MRLDQGMTSLPSRSSHPADVEFPLASTIGGGIGRCFDDATSHAVAHRGGESPDDQPQPGVSRPVSGLIGGSGATAVTEPTLETISSAVAANVRLLSKRTSAEIMAVVKADGYGHGMLPVARAAVRAGATWLGTTRLAEAVELRDAGIGVPILTWLASDNLDSEIAATYRIDMAIGSVEELEELLSGPATGQVRVHLHVDTGMAREGCARAEWDALFLRAAHAQSQGRIHVVGLMGHLPRDTSACPVDNAEPLSQIAAAQLLARHYGFRRLFTHVAATAAALTAPDTHLDMVRFGAGLVGIDPSNTTPLCAAGRLTAPIVHSSTLRAGTSVGYNSTYTTPRATRISIIPVGYADGIPREIPPEAGVAIEGRRFAIIGQVSMDQIIVDTGEHYFARGTPATIFGPPGEAAPTIHDWARWGGSVPQTIVTGLGARILRRQT